MVSSRRRFDLRWTFEAVRDLRALDQKIADRITRKMLWFVNQASPLRHADPLLGSYKGIYRFRIGDYRVLCEIDEKGHLDVLLVLRVKHRREAYR